MPRPALNLSGQKFGLWTALSRAENIGAQSAYHCVCDCGTTAVVRSCSLKSGGSQSCGCQGRKRLGQRARTHGKHKHHLYRTWLSMHDRCRRPGHAAYPRYGGRGIVVCARWSCFQAFLSDMEPTWQKGLTLDRIDNDGPYHPLNCEWRSRKHQANNRGVTTKLTVFGETRHLTEWARLAGISPNSLRLRLKKGWATDKAVTLGPQKAGRRSY